MPSRICQYVINLIVNPPLRSGPGVFMNGLVPEPYALKSQIFLCGKVYYSNTIIITVLMQTLIPNCQFKNTLSLQICTKIS